MKTVLLWVRDNMSVAAAIVAVAAIAGAVYQAGEADGTDYNFLTKTYQRAKPETKAEIKAAIADGKLTRWEAKKLLQDQLRDGVVVVEFGQIDREQARAQLQATVAGHE